MEFLRRTWAEISKSALVNNLGEIKKNATGAKICAVVKADAYGHSAEIVAPVLDAAGADSFAVSNISEALCLREYGIKKPILILGYTPAQYAKTLAENDISQCVYSREFAELLSDCAQKAGVSVKIHIKLDTGMGRIGFDVRDGSLKGIKDAIVSAKAKNLIFEGVFTHFAAADTAGDSAREFTEKQYELFVSGVEKIRAAGLNPQVVHCDNSAAICDKKFILNMVRPGIILYGLKPDKDFKTTLNLIPAMTFKSVVSFVKEIDAGTPLSYGMTFIAPRKMLVATVAVGYADGYQRKLSNSGEVLVHKKRARVLGRVCMDQIMIDVSDIDGVKMGDEVTLFGEGLPVDGVAEKCGTINYEIVCDIAPRVPRILAD